PQSIQVTPSNTTVQRITQVIHPVGRGKKKALLAHIISERNWSQVLVFTRTKFGANNVAEYLEKNGITSMALHGNKSQAARTQALAGFKSGEVRVLVATDIAARGIDIDDLPHVVNYEIPNVCEDYVHRIGRTGRAGADGAAVNLVCLDEEGFMQDIMRFTKQEIPTQVVEGFGPEPGERAEPIAMGRQTIWGGAGKPPSRDVMQAAARAARTEMLQRVRENKGAQRERSGAGSGNGNRQAPRGNNAGAAAGRSDHAARAAAPRPPQGRGRTPVGDAQPHSHEGRLAAELASAPRAPRSTPDGQPDPMRTSVDMMAERGARRGGNFGGRRGGSGKGGGNGTGTRSGGFAGGGNGPRGSGNPRGPFSR
ncbi:MAG: helicase-related protein, partial [Rhodoferax sp.]